MTWFNQAGVVTAAADPSTYRGGGGQTTIGLATLTHRQMYRRYSWVNVSVNRRSRGVGKTPLKAYQVSADAVGDEHVRLSASGAKAHPLAKLLKEPFPGCSAFRWKSMIVHEYLVDKSAEALVWIDRPSWGAPPTRLIPLRGDLVTRQYRANGQLAFYEWREPGSDEPHRILPEYVARFGFADGVSPLDALADELGIERAALRQTASFYRNGAVLRNVVTTEQRLEDDQIEQIEASLRNNNAGPDKAFGTLVLANLPGASVHTPGVTSADAQTVEHRKLAREASLAVYHVPQPTGGVLDRATFSNIETQTRMWVVDSLGEDYAMIEGDFNVQIIGTTKEWRDAELFVEFDTGEILRGAPLQRAEAYLKWLNGGVRTPNELRKLENLPRINDAWADAIYIPANLTPSGLPGGSSGTPEPTGRVRRSTPPAPEPAETSPAGTMEP